MRTTEVFVEQMLIGLAVVFTVGLMIGDEFARRILHADLGKLALFGAAAYIVGIVYDRVTDSMLSGLEQHHRLLRALKLIDSTLGKEDPFPEDEYRIELLTNHEASLQAQYYRSRMRLSRFFSTLMPGFAAAVGLSLVPCVGKRPVYGILSQLAISGLGRDSGCSARLVGASIVFASYLAAFLYSICRRKLPQTRNLGKPKVRRWYAGWLQKGVSAVDHVKRRGEGLEVRLIPLSLFKDGIGWFAFGPLAVAAAAALKAGEWPLAFLIPGGGLVLTAVAGWVWWRVSETFYVFLEGHHKFYRKTVLREKLGRPRKKPSDTPSS